MKRTVFIFVLTLILAVALVGCGNPAIHNAVENPTPDDDVQTPNPFHTCEGMEAAAALAGFTLELPEQPDEIQVIPQEMIQALYGENGEAMLIRKAVTMDDPSGDSTVYDCVDAVEDVTLKGNGEGYCLAVWSRDGFGYSIALGQPADQQELLALAEQVR